MSTLERLQSTFGVPELSRALFYQFQYALRFELGGDAWGWDRPIRRFLQGIDRSRAVAETLFASSTDLLAIFSIYGPEEQSADDVAEELRASRFDTSGLVAIGSTPVADDGCSDDHEVLLFRHWFACPIPDRHSVNELLWCSVAFIPITPSAKLLTYIVDLPRKLVAHVYDDRGMDVAAMEREPLEPLYSRYREWLLECDLAQMDATFAQARGGWPQRRMPTPLSADLDCCTSETLGPLDRIAEAGRDLHPAR